MHARVVREIAKKVIKDGAHPAHHCRIVGWWDTEVGFNQPNGYHARQPLHHVDTSAREGGFDQRARAFCNECVDAVKVIGANDLPQSSRFTFVFRRPVHAEKEWAVDCGEVGFVNFGNCEVAVASQNFDHIGVASNHGAFAKHENRTNLTQHLESRAQKTGAYEPVDQPFS